MPIEIKELHIKATVVDNKSKPANGAELSKRDLDKIKREVIKDCMQDILQILENKMER